LTNVPDVNDYFQAANKEYIFTWGWKNDDQIKNGCEKLVERSGRTKT
jgi:hypothetical protein